MLSFCFPQTYCLLCFLFNSDGTSDKFDTAGCLCADQPSVFVTLDAHLRQCCSRSINALNTINRDALHNIALYKFLILFYSILFYSAGRRQNVQGQVHHQLTSGDVPSYGVVLQCLLTAC